MLQKHAQPSRPLQSGTRRTPHRDVHDRYSISTSKIVALARRKALLIASLIGARLRIWTKKRVGTEVEICLPLKRVLAEEI
jgi:hypothetical protein